MAGVSKKAAGYIQVKLIPADRNGQTWSGWSQRWVDLLIVSEDGSQGRRDRNPEVWLEIRKSKSSGKPIKQWTVDAKDTVLYRCTSKRKAHAFAVQYRKKDIIYLSGNSESESNDWMKIIRESLWPTDKIVELEVSTERLFEASIIDNAYSASCGLFGKYGHLSSRENKLIMFDNNGSNVIQEWYLHTIRKLEAFEANASDKSQILTVYLGENSSTGCGVIYYYCPKAVSLLKSIQTRIESIFNNIEDDLKVQQATLMSLGALHEVSLEESGVDKPLMTLVIADEIIKAKQELSQSKRLRALKPAVQDATNKNEPFVWKDNEFYEEDATKEVAKEPVKVPVRADYTPPDEEPPKKPRRGSITQSLSFMIRPRAHSASPDSESYKAKGGSRRSSLPHGGSSQTKSPSEAFENGMELQMQNFQHILSLVESKSNEQIFPVVGSPKNRSRAGSTEQAEANSILSCLDECSEENTSRSASLSSFNLSSCNDEKTLDVVDSKPERTANVNQQQVRTGISGSNPGAEEPKTDNEDSLTEELGNVTVESAESIDLDESGEPELDLRLRVPEEENVSGHDGGTGSSAVADTASGSASDVAARGTDDVIARRELHADQYLTNSFLTNVRHQASPTATQPIDAVDLKGATPATIDITKQETVERRDSTHAITISFAPPPKPKRASRITQ